MGPSLSSPPPAAALAGVHSPNAPGRTHGAAPLVSRPRPRPWHGSIQLIPEATASAEAPPAQRPFTERGSRLPRLPAPLVAVPLVRSRARGGRPANIPYSSGRCASSAGRHRPVGRAVGLALAPRAGPVRHSYSVRCRVVVCHGDQPHLFSALDVPIDGQCLGLRRPPSCRST